jgi:hypothetical protein
MGKPEINEYQFLRDFLSSSLFSDFPLMEGFSDTKAIFVIDTFKKYGVSSMWKGDVIKTVIGDRLIEAVARNVGHGENHGFGFPHDLIGKLEQEFESQINEGLIVDALLWGYDISIDDYDTIIISRGNEREYYYQNKKNTMELISYSTLASWAYKALERQFYKEYKNLNNYILNRIPQDNWSSILGKGTSIEEYL